MKSTVRRNVLVGLGVLLVGIQLVPMERSNPPAEGAMPLPAGEVGEILESACMDCHSHETVWPWYAGVAPVKFLVAKHVNDGRRHLNFSTWGAQTLDRRERKLGEIVDEVGSGSMPERSYTWMHSEARLTDAQRSALTDWAEAELARLQAADSASAAPADTASAAQRVPSSRLSVSSADATPSGSPARAAASRWAPAGPTSGNPKVGPDPLI